MNKVTVSAPGKVLLTGGYLVLYPEYNGLVFTMNSRFYTTIQTKLCTNPKESSDPIVVVRSPQFNQTWTYSVLFDNNHLVDLVPSSSAQRNKYIERTLLSVLHFLVSSGHDLKVKLGDGLDITIRGDNPFYAQFDHIAKDHSISLSSPISSFALYNQLPKFRAFDGQSPDTVPKTGLGSSAALIVSLVAALLVYFGDVSRLLTSTDTDIICKLAQISHSLAQGKIGSGFDIAAAINGSLLYRRVPISLMDDFLKNSCDSSNGITFINFTQSLVSLLRSPWKDATCPRIQLPKYMNLMLGDVCSRTDSPSMASQVMKWASANSEDARIIFQRLHEAQSLLHGALMELCQRSTSDNYASVISWCSQHSFEAWKSHLERNSNEKIVELLISLRNIFQQWRAGIHTLSELSHVVIEPTLQSKRIDLTNEVEGVVFTGIPGAGGNDAIVCFILEPFDDPSRVKNRVDHRWSTLDAVTSRVVALPCHVDGTGVRIEPELQLKL